ncbi:hypothetical protein OFD71_43045, partial [Escherichia coli]|nr:hypothetical protein [Escherichia coli]
FASTRATTFIRSSESIICVGSFGLVTTKQAVEVIDSKVDSREAITIKKLQPPMQTKCTCVLKKVFAP